MYHIHHFDQFFSNDLFQFILIFVLFINLFTVKYNEQQRRWVGGNAPVIEISIQIESVWAGLIDF